MTVNIRDLLAAILLVGLPMANVFADGAAAPRLVMPVSEFLKMLDEGKEQHQDRREMPGQAVAAQQPEATLPGVPERAARSSDRNPHQTAKTQPKQEMSLSEFISLLGDGESGAVDGSDLRDTESVQQAGSFSAEQVLREDAAVENPPPVAATSASRLKERPAAVTPSAAEPPAVRKNPASSIQDFLIALPPQQLPPTWRNEADLYSAASSDSDLDTIPVRPQAVSGSLDIVTAVQRAVSSHPSVAEALGRMYEQRERIGVAKAGYYPQVSSGFSSGYRTTTGRSGEAFTVSASQMLYDFGKVSRSVDVANSRVDRNRAEALLTIDDLARDTANAAIEVQRYQTLLKIATEQVAAISELKKLAEKRSALGASTRSDEMQAQSRKEAAMATRLQLQAQLDGWRRTLQNLVGSMETVNVSGEFPGTLDNACRRRFDNFDAVPEIMVADAKRDEARAALKRAESELYPTLSLNADYDYYLNEDRGALSLSEDDRIFSVSLNLSSKIFQGGATRAGKRAAGRALDVAKAERQTAYLGVSQDLREARDQTESLSQRLRLLDARYDNIVKTQELYRQQYLSLGTRTLLDILNTEQEIHQSLFDREDTLRDLERLQIQCLYSTAEIRKAFALDDHFVQRTRIQP